MQRTIHRGRAHTESRADMAIWGANMVAIVGAGIAIAAGAIGLLLAFGYLNEDSSTPFNDGMTWLLGGLVVAIVANVFRREHHVIDPYNERSHRADDVDMFVGNGLGLILGGLAIASAVVGLLLNFEYIKEGNPNPFQDALVWFTAGGILGLAALTFRREPHVGDESATQRRRDYVSDTEMVYDEGDLRAAPRVDTNPRRPTR